MFIKKIKKTIEKRHYEHIYTVELSSQIKHIQNKNMINEHNK